MSKTAYLLSSTLIIAIKEKIEKLTCYIVFKYNHWKPILKGDKASKIEFTILKKKKITAFTEQMFALKFQGSN